MSSTSNAHFSHNLFPSFLSTLSILLSTHLIHFLSHFLGHSIQCLLFLTASAIICWYLPTSDVHLSPDKIRKVRLLILYLLTSSLSKAFLLFMYTHEEVSHNSTSTIDILLSTILSALMISVFIKIKYFFINQEENLIQKMKDLMRERDEALKSSDEHKFLVTTLAHDSRNILNCLNSSLKFLEDGLDASNQNDQNIQEDLLCAKYCSTALLNFLNNCLETQKSLETKQQVTKLNLPELVERIQGIIRPAVQFKKLQTNLTIEENTPTYVYLNESSVVQIMLNLIYNAIKFTDRGSVNVKIGWKPLGSEASKANRLPLSSMNRNALQIKRKDSAKVISAELNRIDSSRNLSGNKGLIRGKLLIEVCDTGCGMPEDALKKLFQPFSQVTADISKKKQGTGLGLWLTKLLVEKISGQTKVTSRVGKGSTFTVLLECQALPDSVALSPRRDLYIEPVNNNNKTAMNVNVNASEPARKKGVLVGDSPVENFCIKNYMRNLKIDVIEEVMTLKDLVNYLKCNMDEELVIVCDERHLDTLSKLNKLNKKFLERKLVITVEDKKENYEKHCDIAGSQYVERPVRWYDFLKAVSGTVTPLENKLGHSF